MKEKEEKKGTVRAPILNAESREGEERGEETRFLLFSTGCSLSAVTECLFSFGIVSSFLLRGVPRSRPTERAFGTGVRSAGKRCARTPSGPSLLRPPAPAPLAAAPPAAAAAAVAAAAAAAAEPPRPRGARKSRTAAAEAVFVFVCGCFVKGDALTRRVVCLFTSHTAAPAGTGGKPVGGGKLGGGAVAPGAAAAASGFAAGGVGMLGGGMGALSLLGSSPCGLCLCLLVCSLFFFLLLYCRRRHTSSSLGLFAGAGRCVLTMLTAEPSSVPASALGT